MLDDFREQAASFEDDEEKKEEVFVPRQVKTKRPFLGMTPQQRFIIALLLLMVTCLLSSFCLLVTEKVVPF